VLSIEWPRNASLHEDQGSGAHHRRTRALPQHRDHSVSPPAVRVPRDYNAAYDLIERNLAAGRAAKLAYVDDASQYTFGELAERVDRFGSGLQAMGLEMEHRVLLALTDTIDFPTAFLGAIKAGIIPIAVNTLLTRKITSTCSPTAARRCSSCRSSCCRSFAR